MIFLSHPENWLIALWVCIWIIIWSYCIQRFFLPQFRYPKSFINHPKRILWTFMKYCTIIAFSCLPLGIMIGYDRPTITIIMDNSLSMRSEDILPTRLHQAQEIIQKLSRSFVINKCIQLQNEPIEHCPIVVLFPSSGSSITDALLLSLQSKDQDNIPYTTIVLTDGWINQWIEIEQVIHSGNQSSLIRLDIYPSTGNIIISWSVIGQQSYKSVGNYMQNYFTINNPQREKNISAKIKNAVLQQHSSFPLNTLFVFIILCTCTFFSYNHLQSLIKMPR